MFDVLKHDEKASFFFIGAEDEKDVPGRSARRFRFYSKLVLSIVSDCIFAHFRSAPLSLYILVNRKFVDDMETYVNRISNEVARAMSRN